MSKKVRILSLDGGGMRGIIPATVMKHIEERLAQKTGDPNARIADYFDMVVGTSTGGILGCFYLTPGSTQNTRQPSPKYKAEEALDFYVRLGERIFNHSKKGQWFGIRQLFDATRYDASAIEKIFLQEFGDIRLSQLLKPCIITTYDLKRQTTFFFNSREEAAKKRDFFLRDVVRSTSAAPTYFSPAVIKNLVTNTTMINIDGGVFANNPGMCAYAEARATKFPQVDRPTAKDMLILSIGTGGGQVDLPDMNNIKKWGVINWAKSIPEIMMDGSLDTVDYQMRNLFRALDKEHQRNYKRIDVPHDQRNYSPDMADASPGNVHNLVNAGIAATREAIQEKDDAYGLDAFIDLLIQNAPEKNTDAVI